MNGSDSNNVVVMATVKGDVHDVGSNVDGVGLSCNNLLCNRLNNNGSCQWSCLMTRKNIHETRCHWSSRFED